MNNRAFRMFEFKFDRVLNREHMALLRFQDTIDEGRERCGFTRACRSGAKNALGVFP